MFQVGYRPKPVEQSKKHQDGSVGSPSSAVKAQIVWIKDDQSSWEDGSVGEVFSFQAWKPLMIALAEYFSSHWANLEPTSASQKLGKTMNQQSNPHCRYIKVSNCTWYHFSSQRRNRRQVPSHQEAVVQLLAFPSGLHSEGKPLASPTILANKI